MREAILSQSEAEFREWLEKNLEHFGIAEILLSQEACPDYMLRMNDGKILKVEAELFAINFRYHGHDPAKVDLIIACYSKTSEVDGVPVLAANELWSEEFEALEPLPPEGPLSPTEEIVLSGLSSGGIELSALARTEGLSGEQLLFRRIPPSIIGAIPRGRPSDSLFTVVTPQAKEFMKKFHHVLIGAGLSDEACEALSILRRRGLVEYRPLDFMSAMYDGVLIDHPGWVPTEVRATKKARELHRDIIMRLMFPEREEGSEET